MRHRLRLRLRPRRRPLVAVASLGLTAVLAIGCSHHTAAVSPYKVIPPSTAPAPATSTGQGYLELSGHYYPFTVASCVSGPAPSDQPLSVRVYGVYANGRNEGQLFTVSMTEYRSQPDPTVQPSITDAVLVHMLGKSDGKTIGLGLRAQRVQTGTNSAWIDTLDPNEHRPLLTHDGDRYTASAQFGPDDSQPGDPGVQPGKVVAVCPEGGMHPGPTTSTSTRPAGPTTVP